MTGTPPDVPVLTVTSIEAELRDAAVGALLCDLPGAVAVRHDIDPAGLLHQVVHDLGGVRGRATVPLEHGCLSCALKADLLPVLRALISESAPAQHPTSVVVALPVTTSAAPLVAALHGRTLVPGAAPAGTVATTDAGSLLADLFGDDLLSERGLHLHDGDRRAVGEALAAQLEYADAVVTPVPPGPTAGTVLRHLVPARTAISPVSELDASALRHARRAVDDPRGDIRRRVPTGAVDTGGVWTLDLHSWRPFHPDRLRAEIERLGTGPIRGRGCFWLPGRPATVAEWDCAGGQLSLGDAGDWDGRPAMTRLVVTGLDHDPESVRAAFHRALCTETELARGAAYWTGRPDGFDPWLGTRAA